jgi:uncharacterized protein YodC (DUF2158 family)
MINTAVEHEKQFLVGQSVRLNSGSPKLVITEKDGDKVTVEWKQSLTVPAACLTALELGC